MAPMGPLLGRLRMSCPVGPVKPLPCPVAHARPNGRIVVASSNFNGAGGAVVDASATAAVSAPAVRLADLDPHAAAAPEPVAAHSHAAESASSNGHSAAHAAPAAATANGNGASHHAPPAPAGSSFVQHVAPGMQTVAVPEYRSPTERRRGGGPARPLLPTLDVQRLVESVMGEPSIQPHLQALFKTYEAGTGPRIYTPAVSNPRAGDPSLLPLIYYLPGIDGTGLAAYRQFPSLCAAFDVRALFLPPEDRMNFEELVSWLVVQVEAEAAVTPASRPIYLLGESCGALLAFAVAQRCSAVDRIVVSNPATSFADSVWPSVGPTLTALPDALYRLLPIALSPLLTNPLAVAANNVDSNDSPLRQVSDLAYGLLELLPELSSLRTVLPPATLAHRLILLREGAIAVNRILPQIPQRVLVLAGEKDQVIPSAKEVARLKGALPRCVTKILPGRSHAMLQEAGLDLVQIMRDEGFYVRERCLTSGPAARLRASGKTSTEPPAKRTPANFGSAPVLEVPTRKEVLLATDAGGIKLLRRVVSPVFYSTRAEDGAVVRGLGAVPAHTGPMLFVGPHSLFAPDMPLMIEELLLERGMMIRGLAHPVALQGMSSDEDKAKNGGGGDAAAGNPFGNFLASFGAVPVNGRNFHKLLSQGEAVLLYPGGVREAFKYKNEKHTIIWPTKTEFVRMAARFGATIVPFAHVGAEDGITQVLDGRELLALPFIGDMLRKNAAKLPQARTGVNVSEDIVETFVQPLITFNPPARFYYLFGKPFQTTPAMYKDKDACDEMYSQIKTEVESGFTYLQRKRLQDPYADLGKRLLWEFAHGQNKTAPSFIP